MSERRSTVGSPKHPRQLPLALSRRQQHNLRGGALSVIVFSHGKLPRRGSRNLRQMRDAEHLVRSGQRTHLAPNLHRHLPADIGVNLVKDQKRNAVLRGQNRLECEHHARNFTAGGDRAQRLGRLARVRRKFKFRQLRTRGFRLRKLFKPHGKSGAQKSQIPQLRGHTRRKRGRRLGPRSRKFSPKLCRLRRGGSLLLGKPRHPLAMRLDLIKIPRRLPATCHHVVKRLTVFSFEPLKDVGTFFQLLQLRGIAFDALDIIRGLAFDVGNSLRQFPHRRLHRRRPRIKPRQFTRRLHRTRKQIPHPSGFTAKAVEHLSPQFTKLLPLTGNTQAGHDLLVFAHPQIGPGNFLHHVPKHISPRRQFLLGGTQFRRLRRQPLNTPMRLRKILRNFLRTRKRIQHPRLRLTGKKRLVIMRPMQIHQHVTKRLEQRKRTGRTIHKLPPGTPRRQRTLDQQLPVGARLGTVVGQQRVHPPRLVHGKHRLDRAGFRPAANERFVRAHAKQQLQCTDQDGFARARLTGDGDKPRTRLPCEILDQREIFNSKGCKRCDHTAPYAKVAFSVMAELSITFLGTGTSQGVPFVGCDCRVCTSKDTRDQRLRSSILVEAGNTAILVDTTPDLRMQALRHGLRRIDAAVFTHSHTDHVAGFDDLRRFCELSDRPMPIYASPHTMADLRRIFYYAFDGQHAFRNYVRPDPHEVSAPFSINDIEISPTEVPHGKMLVYGYIFSRGGRKLAAYFSDCHHVPPDVIAQITDIPVLIIDALRHKPHPSHLSLSEALEVSDAAKARRTWFTHIGHDLGHAETEAILPPDVRLAYDGLRLEI